MAYSGPSPVIAGTFSTPFTALTSSATIAVDCSQALAFYVELDHNAAFTFSNMIDGTKYVLVIEQGATGGTGSFAVGAGSIIWVGGAAPTLSTGAGTYDIIAGLYHAATSTLICDAALGAS